MMRNIALSLCYDGSNYHGWQVQKNDITVAGVLEKALSETVGHTVKLVGCGRTDAGVHALRYCANFWTESKIPMDRLPFAVNSRLPSDIAVSKAMEVEQSFNAISNCVKKEYVYKILNTKIRDPFLDKRVCFYPAPLDMSSFSVAARAFEGEHDFKAVRSVGTVTKTTVRRVYWCRVSFEDGLICLSICANGFLYNMARTIAGTCIYAAHGKIRPEDIPELLRRGDRRMTGPNMPAQGLYLNRLWYDGKVGEMFC